MIIAHDITALRICNNLAKQSLYANKLMRQISTGLRINSAADDPAGLAISEKMRSQIRGLQQAARNAQDSISLMQTAEGALNENVNVLQRIRELVVQASNGTLNGNDRGSIQAEIDQLLEEVDRISKFTEFNGMKLLDGSIGISGDGLSFQIGANTGEQKKFCIEDMGKTALGVDGINVLNKTPDEISDMLETMDDAIKKVSSQRSEIGAGINAMEMRIDYLNNAGLNLEEAESRIRDVDMAKAIMEYTKVQIQMQISLALLAQQNKNRQNIITLLFDIKQ